MFEWTLAKRSPRSVLCLGAHCDDIEIGCAATLMRIRRAYPDARFHWVVFSSTLPRADEARRSAAALLGDGPTTHVEILDFQDGHLPYLAQAVKGVFERLKRQTDPDLIFTHHCQDAHQDHRLVGEMTWNTFRRHAILEYEIPKYDGGLGSPNAFVAVDEADASRKVDHLLAHFPGEAQRPWFTADLFRAMLRLRGVECAASSGLAEGFHAKKIALGV